MHHLTLNNIGVLVTRPDPAGRALCHDIEQAGGKAFHFPTIAFSSMVDSDLFKNNLLKIPQQDWLIFTSLAAVRFSLPLIEPYLSFSCPRLAAIGASTAQLLQTETQLPILFPTTEWHSEALLALPPFLEPQHKQMMLIKGLGGRTLLETTLTQRGAQVCLLIAYQRKIPTEKITGCIDLLKKGKIQVIIGASSESIGNLKKLLGTPYWPILRTIPLIVMSERIKILAHYLGFQTIWVAEKGDYMQKIAAMF